MNDTVQQTAADTATEAAIDAVVTNAPPEKTEAAFNRATVEHKRAAAAQERNGGEHDWRDGAELAPMPEAPRVETSEVDRAIAKLTERGGDHAALVDSWGSGIGENLAYAKSAFREISASRPDLIAKFEASGLGDDPAVLEFLSKHGRLSAGLTGDNTIASKRNNVPMPINRTTPPGPAGDHRGSEETRSELARLMHESPPGSQRYKDPHIQARIQQLHRTIAGSGSPVGVGGRRV